MQSAAVSEAGRGCKAKVRTLGADTGLCQCYDVRRCTAHCSPRAQSQVPGICAALAGHWTITGGGDLNAGPRGNTETGAALAQSVEQ